jgi:ArsR family transcriptional regulator, zinc-responsive transcriptional repressor
MRINAYMVGMEKAARMFLALSEPARLEILASLARKGCCVSVLQLQTGRSQPNISQHLRVLRDCGLVSSKREGRKICYSIANGEVKELVKIAEKSAKTG